MIVTLTLIVIPFDNVSYHCNFFGLQRDYYSPCSSVTPFFCYFFMVVYNFFLRERRCEIRVPMGCRASGIPLCCFAISLQTSACSAEKGRQNVTHALEADVRTYQLSRLSSHYLDSSWDNRQQQLKLIGVYFANLDMCKSNYGFEFFSSSRPINAGTSKVAAKAVN